MPDSLLIGEAHGGLAYSCVNPLEYGEEIKDLFVAHDRPEFPAYFDRTYADAVADGATSWIARDEHGRICAHVAQFPRPFQLGPRSIRGSLLANLMVAKAHRTLWPALTLMRRLVKDVRDSGNVDFLYGDPNPAALAIVRAVGFRTVGALWRYVLPLRDRRGAMDLGIRLYHLLGRWRVRPTSLVVSARPARETPAGPEIDQPTDARALTPVPRPSVYRHRLSGYPGQHDWWYTFHVRGSPGGPAAAALVRGPDDQGMGVVCGLHCETALLSSVLVSLVRALRKTRIERLELSVMGESPAAAAVQRAGFVARQERIPIVAMPLTPLGTDAIGSETAWRLLPTDLDR